MCYFPKQVLQGLYDSKTGQFNFEIILGYYSKLQLLVKDQEVQRFLKEILI